MAKRMNFSVIGLPHYTIWHLYEPSLDDLRHMEEMDREREAREEEERRKQSAEQKRSKETADSDHSTGPESTSAEDSA